jgi:hypothetical protein
MTVVAFEEHDDTPQGNRCPDSVQDDRYIGMKANLVNNYQNSANYIVQFIPKRFIGPFTAVNAVEAKQQHAGAHNAQPIIENIYAAH